MPACFFCIASDDGCDNTPLVLDAFGRSNDDARLALVGSPPSLVLILDRLVDAAGICAQVDMCGWIADEGLRSLYRGAIALVHPGKFRAFGGYPPLKALCQATPVINLEAQGASPLEGFAAMLPNEDPCAPASAMVDLVEDGEKRDRMGERGRGDVSVQLGEGRLPVPGIARRGLVHGSVEGPEPRGPRRRCPR